MTTSSFTQKDVETLEREILYQGFFSLVQLKVKYRLFNGGWNNGMTRDIMERTSAAALLPYDPKEDRVILIEQFRIGAIDGPVSPWLIEIPAGLIEKNEKPEHVAIRETDEEAGCVVSNVKLIFDFFASPGASNEYIYLYYGEVDSRTANGIHGLQNEQEDIKVLNISREEAMAKLHRHEIKNVPAIIALQWLELHHAELRRAHTIR